MSPLQPPPWSVRPPEPLRKRLQEFVEARGLVRHQFIVEAIEEKLDREEALASTGGNEQ